jgi:transposase
LRRRRGGFSSKIDMRVDCLGNPFRVYMTGGQRDVRTWVQVLLEGFDFGCLIADRGYAAEDFVEPAEELPETTAAYLTRWCRKGVRSRPILAHE